MSVVFAASAFVRLFVFFLLFPFLYEFYMTKQVPILECKIEETGRPVVLVNYYRVFLLFVFNLNCQPFADVVFVVGRI